MQAFYYDVVCPYAYMAFSFLKNCDAFKRNEIQLKPILLGGLFKHLEADHNPNKTLGPIKSGYIKTDIKRQAAFFSAPLSFHPRHPVSTVKAMRLIHAGSVAEREALTARLYEAYWQENACSIDNDDVLKSLAEGFSVDHYAINGEQAKQDLILETQEAFEKKVFWRSHHGD